MSSIYSNLRTDRQYSAATGLKKSEFAAVYSIFALYYEPKKKVENSGAALPVLTDKSEALFFILHYLKASPTYENLGLYFGISQASAVNYVKALKPILKRTLLNLEVLPLQEIKAIKDLQTLLSSLEDIVIDVSEIRVERPDNKEVQKQKYSGKKKTIQ